MRAARKTLKKKGGLFGLFKTYKPDPSLPVYKSKSGKQVTETLPDPKNYNFTKIIFSKDGRSWSVLNDTTERNEYMEWKEQSRYQSMEASWNAATREQKSAAIIEKLRQIGMDRRMRGDTPLTQAQKQATHDDWIQSYNKYSQGYLIGEDGKPFAGGKKSRKTRRRRA
jgi:hypothetical protein